MAVRAEQNHAVSPDAERMLRAMASVRQRTLALVSGIGDEALQKVHSPLMSPLVWDLGHIAAYEDLWLAHRHGDLELLRGDLADAYDAFETPRAVRGDIEILGPDDARAYLADVRARSNAVLADRGLGDGVICEMVLRHELQHTETMRQTMAIAGLLGAGEPALAPQDDADRWLQIPAGPFAMGAPAHGFAYDNERPQHTVDVGAFAISRRPVSNASWMRFSEGGGYVRREWWSQEGWAWKEEYDITHHRAIADAHPEAPVCHVSWFEADAFARSRGARLPTEAEWEKAATWKQAGEDATAPGENGPVSAEQALAGIGQVWEWTGSHFGGYPGFVAYPYREYSEVFFGEHYRVLRGGSWATHPRVATRTFRNWDLPQRRQIFAGLRLTREA
jgi:gamma-glutamyl hercynylcysteine S-oxide synthase